jgi:hypothetical protein
MLLSDAEDGGAEGECEGAISRVGDCYSTVRIHDMQEAAHEVHVVRLI